MVVEKVSKLALAVGEDVQLIPGVNTLKTIGGMLLGKIDDTSTLFKDILIDCSRGITDLDVREQNEFYEECYLIYQYTIQGKAKHNIKLLIQYLKGQVEAKELYIDDFHKYMDILASLTKEEIRFLSIHLDHNEFVLVNAPENEFFEIEKLIQNEKNMIPAYSLQGKGLLVISVLEPTLWGGSTGKVSKVSSYKTPLLIDMFKNINLDLEELL